MCSRAFPSDDKKKHFSQPASETLPNQTLHKIVDNIWQEKSQIKTYITVLCICEMYLDMEKTLRYQKNYKTKLFLLQNVIKILVFNQHNH